MRIEKRSKERRATNGVIILNYCWKWEEKKYSKTKFGAIKCRQRDKWEIKYKV